MKRRDLLKIAAAAGATASFGRAATVGAAQPFLDAPGRGRNDEDYIIVNGLDVSTPQESYIPLLKAGGVDCWYTSYGGVNAIGGILALIDDHKSELVAATTVREIRAAYQQKKISILFGSQASDMLEDPADTLSGAVGAALRKSTGPSPLRAALRGHYELGLRILGIAYNLPNAFGSGNFFPYMGLTTAGRQLVEEIHRLKIILDVGGHTGEQTSLDAIAMSPGVPVICSHTNIQSIADNPRNISDRLIDAIAKTGGVIGLTAVNDFHVRTKKDMNVAHSPRMNVEHYLDQMEYLKKRVGVDHIGIGPDFVEGRKLDYDALNRTPSINRMIISDGPWLYIEGFQKISELPNVIRGLERRGWPRADIVKVMGENWLRVYQAVWGE